MIRLYIRATAARQNKLNNVGRTALKKEVGQFNLEGLSLKSLRLQGTEPNPPG